MGLGSLFDGIGGFPLAGIRHGIEPVWASEIEPWPIKVTEKHFPSMKHLGDITQINGAEIEPVDIITFGSPCQDLSVAGKKEGLAGARSGLFMDAVRIIREMRTATDGQYPRFAVWENVPGAFSSNKRQDFRAVLEEVTETEIPMPASGKWATAGMVRTERVDVAWRVLDAQHWGVPQRRRRIFLVADFGGQCAGEVLFKPEGLQGNTQESGKARKETAATVGDGVEKSSECLMFENHGQDTRFKGPLDVAQPVTATFGMGGNNQPFVVHKSPAVAMCINTKNNRFDAESQTFVIEPRSQDGVCRIHDDGIVPTLNTAQGGQRQPCVMVYPAPANTLLGKANLSFRGDTDTVIYGICSDSSNSMKSSNPHSGIYKADTTRTLDLNGGNPACNQGGMAIVQHYAVRRLTPLECLRLQGFPDYWLDIKGMSDTAKYKAIGNSVAIPCVEFMLGRIAKVLKEVS